MTFIKVLILLLLSSIIMVGIVYVVSHPASTPQEFEYKHHDYIYFPGKGTIHSPECRQCAITFERI